MRTTVKFDPPLPPQDKRLEVGFSGWLMIWLILISVLLCSARLRDINTLLEERLPKPQVEQAVEVLP